VPFELLRHEQGWLGTTHVVARCPSFQYLEELVAPNAYRPLPAARATVAQVAAVEQLGVLEEAEADADTALRAATLLGLEPELRHVGDTADARTLFAGTALVHYIGHGFASELGEWLPVSAETAITPDEVEWPADEAAPAVFFNACLVGRVRHVAGGRQKGWAITLLARGAPAVIGALASVPDTACPLIAREIYRAAAQVPLGEALRRARERLEGEGHHPLLAAAYVLHGDPNALLTRRLEGPRATADLTARWPARLTRRLATGERQPLDDAPEAVRAWAPERFPALIEDLLDRDPEGAGALRLALGTDPRTAALIATALRDGYAMAALAE
jgi:hypothetical protein